MANIMQIKAIKTHRVTKSQDLNRFIEEALPAITEETIVVVTSKIVSLCEGRTIDSSSISKKELIYQEADRVIPYDNNDECIVLTYKNRILIPSAGIDESNSNGRYILYPKNPFLSAKNLHKYLKQQRQLKHFGVLITDSHTTPLRQGVTGIALAWWGFQPCRSFVGAPDLFGHPLQFTHINVVDALAVSAVFNMGESSECTPLAIITETPHVQFDDGTKNHNIDEIAIDPRIDLYRPLLGPLLQQ